jgi:hypothetical protein
MYCDGTNVVASGVPFDSVANTGSATGTKNLIINGNPVINQRGYVSGTPTSGANQYTLDRWRVVVSGQSVSWADSAGIRTITAPAGGMEQVIEALNNLGGVHTLSWTGTATATVDGNSVTNGSQVTLTGNTNVTIRLTGGTWSRLQLEPGNFATPFERRQYGAELVLCQRYFQKTFPIGTAVQDKTGGNGGAISCAVPGGVVGFWLSSRYTFPVIMRAAPSVAYFAPQSSGTNNWVNGANSATSTPGLVSVTDAQLTVALGSGTSFSIPASDVYYIHATLSAEL